MQLSKTVHIGGKIVMHRSLRYENGVRVVGVFWGRRVVFIRARYVV